MDYWMLEDLLCKYRFVCAQCHVQKRDIKYWWIIEWHLSQLWIHGLLYDTSKWHWQLSILIKVALILFHILTSISFIFGSCVDRITMDSLIRGSHLQMTLTIIRWGGGYRKEKAQCYSITSHFLTAIYLTTHSDTGILVAEGPFHKVLERCQTRICEICKKGGSPTRPILFLIFESVHHPILWGVYPHEEWCNVPGCLFIKICFWDTKWNSEKGPLLVEGWSGGWGATQGA